MIHNKFQLAINWKSHAAGEVKLEVKARGEVLVLFPIISFFGGKYSDTSSRSKPFCQSFTIRFLLHRRKLNQQISPQKLFISRILAQNYRDIIFSICDIMKLCFLWGWMRITLHKKSKFLLKRWSNCFWFAFCLVCQENPWPNPSLNKRRLVMRTQGEYF